MSTPLICVFTRLPVAGKTKTRLEPALGATGAAKLQRLMGEHTMRQLGPLAASGKVRIEICYTGGGEAAARDWLGPVPDYYDQGGGSLGQRMSRASAHGFARGYDPVVIIGTDCPDLGPEQLRSATDLLDDTPLVLGPAADGGYYLIGIAASAWEQAEPALFSNIDWGTDAVLAQTIAAAERQGMSAQLLEVLTDVDRPSDLHAWEKWRSRTPSTDSTSDGHHLLISIIIPTLEEEAIIGECIDQLATGENIEVIVSDGGSSDNTRTIAAAHGAAVVASRAGRARQMNAGAACASGEILLFLHADTRLPDEYDRLVREAVAAPGTLAGAFEFATDIDSLIIRFIEAMTGIRSRRLGITFGDQGIFVKASVFQRLGGYPVQPIMEDYELVRRLRRCGRMVIVPSPAMTSARRWRANGVIKNTFINVTVTIAYLLHLPMTLIHGYYRRMNSGYRA